MLYAKVCVNKITMNGYIYIYNYSNNKIDKYNYSNNMNGNLFCPRLIQADTQTTLINYVIITIPLWQSIFIKKQKLKKFQYS